MFTREKKMKWIYKALFCLLIYAIWGMAATPAPHRMTLEDTKKTVVVGDQKNIQAQPPEPQRIVPPILSEPVPHPVTPHNEAISVEVEKREIDAKRETLKKRKVARDVAKARRFRARSRQRVRY